MEEGTAGWPTEWDSKSRGLSVAGLRLVAETANFRSSSRLWRDAWITDCAPPGWVAEAVFDDNGQWMCDRLTNLGTGEIREKCPHDFSGAQEAETDGFVAPAGCRAVIDARPELATHVGQATHFLTYPWTMPFEDLIAAADRAVDGDPAAFFFFDRLCLPYHNSPGIAAEISLCEELIAAMQLVQVVQYWDNGSHMNRLWFLFESAVAVAHNRSITLQMTESQQQHMADALVTRGPDAILAIAFDTQMGRQNSETTCEQSYDGLFHRAISEQVDRFGGLEKMELELADHIRRTYATVIDRELEVRWEFAAHSDDRAQLLASCDLGHQLACLWALTSNPARAEDLFDQVIRRLNDISIDDGTASLPADKQAAGAVARLDLTSAEFVKLLKQQKRTDDAHTVQRQASHIGTLPVSWEGVSIEFMERFVSEHRGDTEFLSTDAVVERIVKPQTRSTVLFDPNPKGIALIESVHESHRGTPNFFLTHAWRQTFLVPDTAHWRGGLAQAIIDSCPEEQKSSTYFWFDIFTVNQHQTSLAFAFDPLRNAIIECSHLKVFMETWDDPAPLSRVWCLDELRNALLLGKRVQICMPTQAMRSFKTNAEKNPQAAIESIKRVCSRVSIQHASATREEDRAHVLKQVEDTLDFEFLNEVCREIIRNALLEAAGIDREALEPEEQWKDRWCGIFQKMIDATNDAEEADGTDGRGKQHLLALRISELKNRCEKAGVAPANIDAALDSADSRAGLVDALTASASFAPAKKKTIPQIIEIKRAVSMMQRRIFPRGSPEYAAGTELLKEVEQLSRRFYGEKSQLYSDIARQLSASAARSEQRDECVGRPRELAQRVDH